jgi:shikimate kinase
MQQRPIHDGLPSRIFLLGFMGSGKSTLGPIIANTIAYDFYDLDASIQERHQTLISSLFNELGESGFRKVETAELRHAADLDQTVISTGGGIVTVAENRRIINDFGFSVYLKLSAEALAARLGRSKDRPMLFGEDGRTLEGDLLVKRIDQLIASRAAEYESADLIVDIEDGPVGKTVDYVVRRIYASAKRSI